MNKAVTRRTLLRHPMAAIGGALLLAGGALFIVLLMIDFTSGAQNPYRSLVTFVVAPFIVTVGFGLFLVSVWVQVRAARRRGETVRFNLTIDPTDPAYMKNLWLFLGLTAFLVIIVIYSGTKAYDATDSVAFCGSTCHTVMQPENVTYHNSPHARVPCVDCHIGPGASFWVKSKVDGLRQVWKTMFNTYERPIKTPIENLRPAQQTCEKCHWPNKFYGDNLVTHTFYRTDENNSPWTINMLVKIGGGNPRTGALEGIHWHMVVSTKIEYMATDYRRQNIAWVRAITLDGDTAIFTRPGESAPNSDSAEIRAFDCMDCHNRPSHEFTPPAVSLNLALSSRQISPDLPYIRKEGLDLLNAEYESREQADTEIGAQLVKYYRDNYPQVADSNAAEIEQAHRVLVDIFNENFFPGMKTDYRGRFNNLGHFVNDGCFRCHDGVMKDAKGNVLSRDCDVCHLIVAEGPSENVDDLESKLTGLEFKHPEDIDEAWKEMKCTECHDPESGY
jgi:hypothetical protein